MIDKEKLKKSSEEIAESVFNINEWAEKQKVFWDDFEKNVLMLPITDTLIRHKWPEEKPEAEKSYWARVEINGVVSFAEMYWSEQLGWHTQHGKHITHWWNLPEVME